jgi:hypothetical protein
VPSIGPEGDFAFLKLPWVRDEIFLWQKLFSSCCSSSLLTLVRENGGVKNCPRLEGSMKIPPTRGLSCCISQRGFIWAAGKLEGGGCQSTQITDILL